MRDQCFGGTADRNDARNLAVIITDGLPIPPELYQPTILLAEDLRQYYSKFKTNYYGELNKVRKKRQEMAILTKGFW